MNYLRFKHRLLNQVGLSLFILFTIFGLSNNANASCSVGGSINFGVYNTLDSSDSLSTGNLNVSCSSSTSFNVGLGTGQSNNYLNRTLNSGGSDLLNYNLFTNVSRTSVFGDGSGSTATVSQTTSGSISIPIYGSIPAKQNVTTGSYIDTVAVYLTF